MSEHAVDWGTFVAEAPELAAKVEARLRAFKHHVLATLRRDGSPRVSGTEVQLLGAQLCAGMMPGSRKAEDLRGDPRWALHANPGDGSMEGGDAKLWGVARELVDDASRAEYAVHLEGDMDFVAFELALSGVTLTELHPAGDRLRITTWHPGSPPDVVERA